MKAAMDHPREEQGGEQFVSRLSAQWLLGNALLLLAMAAGDVL